MVVQIFQNILSVIKKPANDKTGIGYKSEVTNASTSTSTEKTGTYVKNTSNQMESIKQKENQISSIHRRQVPKQV